MDNNGADYSGKSVVVGLTGRIASCVTALLLKKQGMKVIGVSIVTNNTEDFDSDGKLPICHISDLDRIKAFCESLNIQFYATDAKSKYEAEVLDPFIGGKLIGTANNACFDCNTLRLNILFDKMKKLKADYISTGHFCKVQKNVNSDEYFIHSNNDPTCDQSLLLGGISSQVLKHLILPLGELRFEEVIKIAHRFELNYSKKGMDLKFCFQKKADYIKLIKKRIPKKMLQEGNIHNRDTDVIHGEHEGVIYHYIGENELQVKGAPPLDKELEIVDYDFVRNIIYIGSGQNLTHRGLQLVNLHFAKGLDLTKPMLCFIKNKFSKKAVKCTMYFKNNSSAFLSAQEDIYPLITEENFVILDREGRNAKIIATGRLGVKGDFELIDRVRDFRSHEQEGGDVNAVISEVEIFKF